MAQEIPSDFWHRGNVYQCEGDTISGLINYDLNRELIQFKNDSISRIYTVKNIDGFSIEDTIYHDHREFLVYEREIREDVLVRNFFQYETTYKDYELLSREILVHTAKGSIINTGFSSDHRDVSYAFFLFKENTLYPIDVNKRSLLELFEGKEEQILNYMKVNKVRLSSRQDVVNLFEYYKTLP